jgi:5-methylcytosine-specific restriction enzyme A
VPPPCPIHGAPRVRAKAEYNERRGSSTEQGYDTVWERVRATVLRNHPLCAWHLAAEDRPVGAVLVDHVIAFASRPELRLDRSNLASLCRRCHDRKAGLERNGRTGNLEAFRALEREGMRKQEEQRGPWRPLVG